MGDEQFEMKEVSRQPIKQLKKVTRTQRTKIHKKALVAAAAACVKKGGKWVAGKCSPKDA